MLSVYLARYACMGIALLDKAMRNCTYKRSYYFQDEFCQKKFGVCHQAFFTFICFFPLKFLSASCLFKLYKEC